MCGNSESVKFISEWLHSWRERDIRAIKDSCGSDRSCIPTSNDDCYVTDSDSENTEEGNSLKNVLLVKGPVGVSTINIFLIITSKFVSVLFFVCEIH